VTLEFAITLPIFFLLLYASVELGRMFTLLNTAENAAYEGARSAIVPGATAADAVAAASGLMQSVGTSSFNVAVDPTTIYDNTPSVEVTVSLAMAPNSYLASYFIPGQSISRSCRLTRELFQQTTVP
jgi:Flp pilus assembly protein TadG